MVISLSFWLLLPVLGFIYSFRGPFRGTVISKNRCFFNIIAHVVLTGRSQVSAMHIHIHIIPSNKDGIFPPQISRVICHQSFIGALSEIGQVSVSLLAVEAFYVDTYPLLGTSRKHPSCFFHGNRIIPPGSLLLFQSVV